MGKFLFSWILFWSFSLRILCLTCILSWAESLAAIPYLPQVLHQSGKDLWIRKEPRRPSQGVVKPEHCLWKVRLFLLASVFGICKFICSKGWLQIMKTYCWRFLCDKNFWWESESGWLSLNTAPKRLLIPCFSANFICKRSAHGN